MSSITETIQAHRPDLGPYEELCLSLPSSITSVQSLVNNLL
jgi:hypothetical protein